MRHATLAAIVFAALPLLGTLALPTSVASGQEPVILTVTGAVETANRLPFDAFEDALFGIYGEAFEQAYTFTRADLLALPQHETTARYPDWPRSADVSGPRLLDVLARAGAQGGRILVQAVDGYSPEFLRGEVNENFILALELEGEPLPLGGRGPLWLVVPPGSYEGQDNETDAALAWAVFHIKVVADD